MEHPILTLARLVRESPDDETAARALTDALCRKGEMATVAALIECWAFACGSAVKPECAVATLYCRLASNCNPTEARRMALAALELWPSCHDALVMFEQHSGPADKDELCNRYLAFLAHAPFHPNSPRVRITLIDKLVDAGRYDEAMGQVNVLPPSSSTPAAAQDIERACSILPIPPLPTPRRADATQR